MVFREQVEQCDPDGPDIVCSSFNDLFSTRLKHFWSHKKISSLRCLGQVFFLRLEELTAAEVTKENFAITIQHDVLWFYITV